MRLVRLFVIRYLLVPSNWLYLLVFFSFFYYNIWLGVSFVLLFPILFNFLPYYLIKKLESKFPNLSAYPGYKFYHIIVLGGGHDPSDKLFSEQQLNNTSLRRVLEGVRLFKANSNSNLVMTGENLKENHKSQAELQFDVAVTMGVNPKVIKTINNPKNTEEEAESYFKEYGSIYIPIVLVTKAIHLRRAARLFTKPGYELNLAPAYFYHTEFQPTLIWFLSPNMRLMLIFSEYLKEVVGFFFLTLKDLKSKKSKSKSQSELREVQTA
ncbi:ElyC/SanA/YdcF family protein [uncultured Algoriphagus sp.]|uniref:YdcF family protein n=1 Tax=uncultured Algoriphagus sp. TaxID=417365 RepID=UPI002596298F|nr:ElyC/SanA/YdcF family protein [uncultured Algoriphagus sp.]